MHPSSEKGTGIVPNFNRVILAGNLTRDPDLRYTPKGTAVAKLGLAINRTWFDQQTQEKREEVIFVDVDAFGKAAETISQYLKKGRPILIEGRLKLDQWDDKQTNQKRQKLGVVLESFQFMDAAPDESSEQKDKKWAKKKVTSDAQSPAQPPEEDDVPF